MFCIGKVGREPRCPRYAKKRKSHRIADITSSLQNNFRLVHIRIVVCGIVCNLIGLILWFDQIKML